MQQFAIFVLIVWVPITIGLFTVVPPRKAAVASLIGAWLILPPLTIPLPGIPDYSKFTATTFGILLGTLLFDVPRLLAFRPRWFDAPMLVWCTCPFASSISNGDGVYDGISQCLTHIFMWGFPYVIGRLYFGDLEGLRELSLGMITGGVAYILPCLWEIKMSPQLMRQVYGLSGWMGMRLGGYRPRVFLSNGLELGTWMSAASLAAWWIWRSGSLKRMAGLPFGTVVLPSLLVTNLLCKSSGALILFMGGVITLWGSVRFKTRTLLLGVMLLTPLYYTVRIGGLWSGETLLDIIEAGLGKDRAWSLEFRLRNENLMIERARERPVLGWGGWGRALNIDSEQLMAAGVLRKVVPDGLWIIAYGNMGAVGLAAVTLVILLPPLLFLARYSVTDWLDPRIAPAAMFSVLLSIYMIDCLANAMVNLIYVVAIGGLVAAVPDRSRYGIGKPHLMMDGHDGASLEKLTGEVPRPHLGSVASAAERLASRYADMGRSLASRGRRNEAKAAWFQAVDLWSRMTSDDPENSRLASAWCDCCNDLACFLIDEAVPEAQDFSQAVALAVKATETFPEECVYWNTLGAAYYRAGDDHSAVTALYRSLSLQDDRGTGFDHFYLALACLRLNQHDIARSWYEQGMSWVNEHAPDHLPLRRLADEAKEVLNNYELTAGHSLGGIVTNGPRGS